VPVSGIARYSHVAAVAEVATHNETETRSLANPPTSRIDERGRPHIAGHIAGHIASQQKRGRKGRLDRNIDD
jgi:hypothetical protein